jgi:hypothetical protein
MVSLTIVQANRQNRSLLPLRGFQIYNLFIILFHQDITALQVELTIRKMLLNNATRIRSIKGALISFLKTGELCLCVMDIM